MASSARPRHRGPATQPRFATVCVSSLAGPAAQAPACTGLTAGASFNFAEGGGSDVESGRGSVACEVGAPGTEEACLVAAG